MDKIFQRLIERDLAELHGLSVDASVPVTEQLANEIFELALLEDQQLDYCRVKIHRENRITVDLKSPRWPWPLTLKLKLFGSVDFTGPPTVRAFLENHLLLGKLGSLFNALPEGIRIFEDQVSVDIGAFINSREQKRFLELIETVDIRTEEGRIFLNVKVSR